jgi:hypothetical protein
MKTSQVTVTTTPVLLVAADPHDQTVSLHAASGACFIGNASVTSTTGFKLDNQDKVTLPLGAYEALYAVTASGTDTVYVYSEVN